MRISSGIVASGHGSGGDRSVGGGSGVMTRPENDDIRSLRVGAMVGVAVAVVSCVVA